jgi:putative ABC transport system permease protein
MNTLELAAREMTRRRGKTWAILLCVVLGISVVVAARTLSEALYDQAKLQLLRFGANIIVQPADGGSASYGEKPLIPESYAQAIRKIEHADMLEAVSPILEERLPVNGIGLPVAGITDEQQTAKPWWLIDRDLVPAGILGPRRALLGHRAAELLRRPEAVEIGGHSFEVGGVLDKTGSVEDGTVFVPLAALQEVVSKQGLVSRIEVSTSCIACPSMNVNDVATTIGKVLPKSASVTPVKQIAEAQMGTLNRVESFLRIVAVVMLLLSGLLVMNQISSSVADRRREVGMLLALGMDERRLHLTFFLKALLIGLVGGALGFAIGTLLSSTLGGYVTGGVVRPLYHLLAYALGAAILLCVASSALPARRAARIDPVEALREL